MVFPGVCDAALQQCGGRRSPPRLHRAGDGGLPGSAESAGRLDRLPQAAADARQRRPHRRRIHEGEPQRHRFRRLEARRREVRRGRAQLRQVHRRRSIRRRPHQGRGVARELHQGEAREGQLHDRADEPLAFRASAACRRQFHQIGGQPLRFLRRRPLRRRHVEGGARPGELHQRQARGGQVRGLRTSGAPASTASIFPGCSSAARISSARSCGARISAPP